MGKHPWRIQAAAECARPERYRVLQGTWHVTPVRAVHEGVDGEGVGALTSLRPGEFQRSISATSPMRCREGVRPQDFEA